MSDIRVSISSTQSGNPPYTFVLFRNMNSDPSYFSRNRLSRLPRNPEEVEGFVEMTNPKSSNFHIFKNLEEGYYYAGVIDTLNNWSINPAIITTRMRLVESDKTNIRQTGETGTADGRITGGAKPYLYTLNRNGEFYNQIGKANDKNYLFQDLEAGNYELIITDATNAEIREQFRIEDLQLNNLSVSELSIVRNVNVKGENTGSVSVTVERGSGIIRLDLVKQGEGLIQTKSANRGGVARFNNLISGSYYVLASQQDGSNFRTNTVTLDEGEDKLTARVNVKPITNPITGLGEVEITTSGGRAPITYVLERGTTNLNYPVNNNNGNFTGLDEGRHSGHVRDSLGQRFNFIFDVEGYQTPEFNADEANVTIQSPTNFGGAGKITINSLSGGYNPSIFRLRDVSTGEWANEWNSLKTQTAKAGTYELYAKEPEPLNTEYFVGQYTIPEFFYNRAFIDNIEVMDASGVLQNDGEASFIIREGVGPFEIEITPQVIDSNKNYADIVIQKMSETEFTLKNLPTGTHNLTVIDVPTQDRNSSTQEESTPIFDLEPETQRVDAVITIGSPAVEDFLIYIVGVLDNVPTGQPSAIFANCSKIEGLCTWELIKIGDNTFRKTQTTNGPVAFLNILPGLYELTGSDAFGNSQSKRVQVLAYIQDELNIVSVTESFRSPLSVSANPTIIEIEGGTPPYTYTVKERGAIDFQEETISTQLTLTLSNFQYLLEVTDTENTLKSKIFNSQVSLQNVADSFRFFNIKTSGETAFQAANGTIEASVSGGKLPATIYLYDRNGMGVSGAETNIQSIEQYNENVYWSSLEPGRYFLVGYDTGFQREFTNGEIIFEDIYIEPYPVNEIETTINVTPISQKGAMDAKLTVNSSGGLDNGYKVTITNQENETIKNSPYNIFEFPHEITGLGPGVYVVRIEDLNDPSNFTEEVIEIFDTFSVTANVEQGNVRATLSPLPGGMAPFVYNLFRQTSMQDEFYMSSQNTNARSYTFIEPMPGIYYVKVRDKNGFEAMSSVFEVIAPIQAENINLTVIPPSPGREDGVVTIEVINLTGQFTYEMINGPDGYVYPRVVNSGIFDSLKSGDYQFRVKDEFGNEMVLPATVPNTTVSCEDADINVCDPMMGSAFSTSTILNTPPVHNYILGNNSGLVVVEVLRCEMPSRMTVNYKGSETLELDTGYQMLKGMYYFQHNGNIPEIEVKFYPWDSYIAKVSDGKAFNYKYKIHCPNSELTTYPQLSLESVTSDTSFNPNNANGSISFNASGTGNMSFGLVKARMLTLNGTSYDGEAWEIMQPDFSSSEIRTLLSIPEEVRESPITFNGLEGIDKGENEQPMNELSKYNASGYYIIGYDESVKDSIYGCLIEGGRIEWPSAPCTTNTNPSILKTGTGDMFAVLGPIMVEKEGLKVIDSFITEEVSCPVCTDGQYEIQLDFTGQTDLERNTTLNSIEILDANKNLIPNEDWGFARIDINNAEKIKIEITNIGFGNQTLFLNSDKGMREFSFDMQIQKELSTSNPVVIVRPTPSAPNSGHVRITIFGVSTLKGTYLASIRKFDSSMNFSTPVDSFNVTLGNSDLDVDFYNLEAGVYRVALTSLTNVNVIAVASIVV